LVFLLIFDRILRLEYGTVKNMKIKKRVISASRRTDLVASYPEWLGRVLEQERAHVLGPSGRIFDVSIRPRDVHTLVLWSKDFSKLIGNHYNLREMAAKYDQVCIHFTVTGLGGTAIEPGVPSMEEALDQLSSLIEIVGDPLRISFRFDPVLFWIEAGIIRSNLDLFKKIVPAVSRFGIRDIRFSFAQWYGKAVRRARSREFAFTDPSQEKKREEAQEMACLAASHGCFLSSCSQSFLEDVPGIIPSGCIDGERLQSLHPNGEPAERGKDPGQRRECGCTRSTDIGSYTQSCPSSCVYCYANPCGR
jgi:hypothetical protein